MVTVDEFSGLVSGIYAAALTPRHWKQAISEIHPTMGGAGGSLLIADGAIRPVRSVTSRPSGPPSSFAVSVPAIPPAKPCAASPPT